MPAFSQRQSFNERVRKTKKEREREAEKGRLMTINFN